jgi:hypothetical protein
VDGVNVLYTMNNSEARQHLGLACPSEEAKAALAAAPPDSLDRRLWEWTETYGWHHLQVFLFTYTLCFSSLHLMPTGPRISVYTVWDKQDIVQTFGPVTPVKLVEGLNANGWCIAVAMRSWYLVWYLVFCLFHFVFFFPSGASCLEVATRNWYLRT